MVIIMHLPPHLLEPDGAYSPYVHLLAAVL